MALVLTRKRNESIILKFEDGTQVKITVADFSRFSAKFAITAPNTVEVVREELLYETNKGWKRGTDSHDKVIH